MSLIGAFICVVLFGTNYSVIKGAAAHIPPILLSAERLALMGGVMVWFVQMPAKHNWNKLIALATTQFTLNYALCSVGIAETNAGIGSILTQLEVPFAFILSFIFLKEKLTWQQIIGCFFAFLGSYFIFDMGFENSKIIGMIMITVGGLMYAISCFQAKSLTELNAATLTAWCSLLAAPQLLLISIFYESVSYADIQASFSYYPYILYAAASSGIAFFLWTRLIKVYSVSQIMPFALLIPIVGVVGGIVFLDELLTAKIIIGGIITTLGVAFILFKEDMFGRRVADEEEEVVLDAE